jgi:hypothetical protein
LNTFDPIAHAYTIDRRPVPSVTEIIGAFVPQWQASDWHLERGTAVHACAALVARKRRFQHDPAITGQVNACRLFFADFAPVVLHVELPVFSALYQYAGTLDLVIEHDGKPCLVDWKSTLTKAVQWQLGGYAVALKESVGLTVKHGFGVELRDDGKYQKGEVYGLEKAGREFLAMRTVLGAMKREGL